MLSDLNKPQKIFMIILYCLTAVATLVGTFVIYYMATVAKPWTLSVTYADTLNVTEGKPPIINVDIHSNENNNGKPVYDLRINSYTDSEGNGVAGFGIQCVGDWKIINNSDYEKYSYIDNKFSYKASMEGSIKNYGIDDYLKQYGKAFVLGQTIAFGDFYFYYTGDDGKVYSKTSIEDIPNYLLIDIDGKFYRVQNKSYNCEVVNEDFWAFLPWVSNTLSIDTTFTWFELFDIVMESAINSNGKTKYEEFPLALMDLSDFITIQYQDEKGQYHDLEKTTDTRNYFNIAVKYNLNGLTNASDSMFGMIYSSPTWDYYSNTTINDYWNAYSELTITEENLNYVYSDAYDAYCAVLDNNFSEYLDSLTNSNIKITLDFTNLDLEVYGINLQNFTFDIKDFDIKVNSVASFQIINQELCGVKPTLSGV